jgi:hypothetical protein
MKTRIASALAVSGLAVASASATLTVYTDQAAWEQAVSNAGYTPMEETFDGITILDMQPGGGPYLVGDSFELTVTGQQGNTDDAFIDGGRFHGEIFPDTRHLSYVHTFAQPVIGFGQFFDGAATGLGLRIVTGEGEIDIFDYYTGFADGFLGYTSDVPIMSVEIIGSDADGGTAVGEIYDVDNTVWAVVPAPGSLALLGLGALAARRRR